MWTNVSPSNREREREEEDFKKKISTQLLASTVTSVDKPAGTIVNVISSCASGRSFWRIRERRWHAPPLASHTHLPGTALCSCNLLPGHNSRMATLPSVSNRFDLFNHMYNKLNYIFTNQQILILLEQGTQEPEQSCVFHKGWEPGSAGIMGAVQRLTLQRELPPSKLVFHLWNEEGGTSKCKAQVSASLY